MQNKIIERFVFKVQRQHIVIRLGLNETTYFVHKDCKLMATDGF